MTRVGGNEPKMSGTALTQAQEVPEAVPPHEPPSFPLTPDDRASVEEDLDDTRRALSRHANTEPLPRMVEDWIERCEIFEAEIERLEDQLAEDDLNIINHGCLAAVLAGGETWQRFIADAEQRMGMSWAEIKVLLDERYANRTKATT